ncbi:hypothetical protein BDP27DRAFT_1424719 [Rhodocollybia butyracea]|uniref:Uncharacterized protein n=1 Tax=Rhodocollybia butyracea TaxID=206335 RepID=A0A9P5U4C6_9AGAR|nr:hypothetical protein BDP27DRAFT_1424719 [Rhodocollybia butyracea]
MSGGNKRRNSASVHSQKKPKTSGSQPSKKANGPEKPRQVGHVQAYARTFDASAEGAIPKELRKDGLELNDQEQAYLRRFRAGTSGNDSTSDLPHTLDDETQQDSDVTMEYGEGDEGGNGDDGDEGDEGDNGDEGDDMVIKDVTKENKNKNKQNGTRAKVLQSDLASDALAKISKQAMGYSKSDLSDNGSGNDNNNEGSKLKHKDSDGKSSHEGEGFDEGSNRNSKGPGDSGSRRSNAGDKGFGAVFNSEDTGTPKVPIVGAEEGGAFSIKSKGEGSDHRPDNSPKLDVRKEIGSKMGIMDLEDVIELDSDDDADGKEGNIQSPSTSRNSGKVEEQDVGGKKPKGRKNTRGAKSAGNTGVQRNLRSKTMAGSNEGR